MTWAPSRQEICQAAELVNASLSLAWHTTRGLADSDEAFGMAWPMAERIVWEEVARELVQHGGCPLDRLEETLNLICAEAERLRNHDVDLATVTRAGEA